MSAINRNNRFKEFFTEYLLNADIIDCILGKGYNYKQIDIPVLQAIVDMGFLAGILYFAINIVLPSIIILKRNGDGAVCFFKLFAFSMMLQNFYSGIPYGYYKYIWLVLLIFIYSKNNKGLINSNNLNEKFKIG